MAAGISLSPITLGASNLGTRDEGEARELADRMISSSFGQVDTSNTYAAGRSEELLGQAIRRAGGLPRTTRVFSKADKDPESGAFDGDRVKRSFEETIGRLGVDTLPIFHLHDPYDISVRDAAAPGGAIPAMIALREEGLVGAVGIAAGKVEVVSAFLATGAFDALLTHNRYTLVNRSAEPLLEAARDRGMTVFNAAPFGGGILAGSSTAGRTYAYRPAAPELLAYVQKLRDLAERNATDLAAAALQFSLRAPLVDSTVVGVTTPARLDELSLLAEVEVPEQFFEELAALGAPPTTPYD